MTQGLDDRKKEPKWKKDCRNEKMHTKQNSSIRYVVNKPIIIIRAEQMKI